MLREATLPLQMCNYLNIFSKRSKLMFYHCEKLLWPIQILLEPLTTIFAALSRVLSQSIHCLWAFWGTLRERGLNILWIYSLVDWFVRRQLCAFCCLTLCAETTLSSSHERWRLGNFREFVWFIFLSFFLCTEASYLNLCVPSLVCVASYSHIHPSPITHHRHLWLLWLIPLQDWNTFCHQLTVVKTFKWLKGFIKVCALGSESILKYEYERRGPEA
jgi:hypothetical protein